MRKRITILALALISLLALNFIAVMAFTFEPSAVTNPFALAREGLTTHGWRIVNIWLKDAGDSIRLNWPEASFSVLNRAHVLLTWPESILGIENEGLIILLSWVGLSTIVASIWQTGEAWRRHRVETRKRRMRIKATEPNSPRGTKISFSSTRKD